MGMEISVCIATWCRKENLEKIIMALEEQSLDQSTYEIIVCDSNSNDGTKDLMVDLMGQFSNIQYLNSDSNILAAKRNIGIKAATSPIVIFMDDDVFPVFNFIESHLNAHRSVTNTVYCGQVRFPETWVSASNYYKYRDKCHLGPSHYAIHDSLPFNKIVVMNLSFKKNEIIDKVGLVCESFIGYGGEDIEFGYRICDNGMKLVYLPEALAYHHENSPSIISYGEKVYRASRDGGKILNEINPEILKNTKLVSFEIYNNDLNLINKFKKWIFRIMINKYVANQIAKLLVKTDGMRMFFVSFLYRYYLASKSKEGKLAQKTVRLSLDDVKGGWYSK